MNVALGAAFDVSGSTAEGGQTITTLSGAGGVSLGGQELTIANGSTTFSGGIADDGIAGGSGGSLTIAGGTQTLSGANTYTGGTTISGGELDATGAGALQGAVAISSGTLKTFVGQTVSSLTTSSPNAGTIEVAGGTLTDSNSSKETLSLRNLTIDSGASLTLPSKSTITIVGSKANAGSYVNANTGVGNSYNRAANLTGVTVNAGKGVTDAVTNPTIAFGAVHVGTTNSDSFAIQNTSTGNAGNVNISGAVQTTKLTNSALSLTDPGALNITTSGGNFGPVAAGNQTGNYTVGYNPQSSGALKNQSVGVVTNFANAGLQQTVTITGAAYDYAKPVMEQTGGDGSLGSSIGDGETVYTLDLGTVSSGQKVTADLSVLNQLIGTDPAYQDALKGLFTGTTGPFTLTGFNSFGPIAADDSYDGLVVSFTGGNVVGTFTEQITLDPTSYNTAFGDNPSSPLDPIELDITVNAVNTAIPEPSTWAMMALGFATLGLVGWRRARPARPA